MRVSSKSFQLQWLANFTSRQVELADIQRQVSTGKRVATAADDPAGASQIVQLQDGLNRLERYAANAATARRRLGLEESALAEAGDLLDRVRELAIQAGGPTQTTQVRQALADEAREIRRNLLDLANAQDGEGRYLFAGNAVRNQPFTNAGSSVTYNGDDGTRSQRIGDNRVVSEGDPGSSVFSAIRNGNGTFTVAPAAGNTGTAIYSAATVADAGAWPTASFTIAFTAPDAYEVRDGGGAVVQSGAFSTGDTISFAGIGVTVKGQPATGDEFQVAPSTYQDVFTTVDRFIAAMESNLSDGASRAQAQSALNSSLLDLDQALDHLSTVRSSVGSRLAVIERQRENNEDLALEYTQTMSTVRDVDYASAISELEQQLIGLEAAQKTFVRTRSFSLFNLI